MSHDSHTYRARFHVTVKEFGDGTPWLLIETSNDEFPTLGEDLIGLELPRGTTYEKAKEFAQTLNSNIEHISITTSKFIARGSTSIS